METTIGFRVWGLGFRVLGLCRDNGKENGNCYSLLGLYCIGGLGLNLTCYNPSSQVSQEVPALFGDPPISHGSVSLNGDITGLHARNP